jgi:phosphatidylserine decarboxylase
VFVLFGFPCWLTTLWALLTVFVIAFFRNPRRVVPPGDDQIVAPADGRVVSVAEVDDARFGLGRCRRVCIFMSPFNVHVNRAPAAGKVIGVDYRPGQFLVASAEKASLDNEQCALTLERPDGQRLVAVQIAGMLARRIVTYPREGDALAKGQRFGLIRFGSRVDLYLPLAAKIEVMEGDCVFGGVTIIGRFLHG